MKGCEVNSMGSFCQSWVCCTTLVGALFRSARVGVGVHRAGACRVGATVHECRVHRTPCNGRLRLVSLANSSRWLGTALVNISRPPFEL